MCFWDKGREGKGKQSRAEGERMGVGMDRSRVAEVLVARWWMDEGRGTRDEGRGTMSWGGWCV